MTEKTENKPTFEEAMKHLEAIVRDLQSGSAPLEKSLALFKEGTALVDYCTGLLDNAEQEVKKLVPAADGTLREEALDKA